MLGQLNGITEEQVEAKAPFSLPIGGDSMLSVYGFVAAHEAYHIGQMSMLRKQLGHPPMTLA